MKATNYLCSVKIIIIIIIIVVVVVRNVDTFSVCAETFIPAVASRM